MYTGYKRQYDSQGRLLGKCEHCAQLVTVEHFETVDTDEINAYGERVTAGRPRCWAEGVTDRQFNRSTGNSSLYS